MKVIAIDPGHGINTPGKRTPLFEDGSYMKENEFNRAVADYLDTALHRNGFRTLIVAPEMEDIPLETRVQRANEGEADCYISIHANASGESWSDANGIETYLYATIGDSSSTYSLAEEIQRELIKKTGLRDRGVKKADFYVLRKTWMPAVLIECGFMTNRKEAVLLKSENYRKTCAEAICKGICSHYNIKYKGEEKELTIEEAKKIIKEKCHFDENTMKYLEFYRYADSMLIRLAENMK